MFPGARFVVAITTLVFVLSLANASELKRLPHTFITASGTIREVGRQVGKGATKQILNRYNRPDIQTGVLPFINTTDGRVLMEQLLTASKRSFPRLVEEMEGVAEGCGLTFREVFMLNCLYEIESYMQKVKYGGLKWQRVGHCTDIVGHDLRGSGEAVWGHNEDGGPYDREAVYYVNATVTDAPNGVTSFVCLTYAGSVCANAYGFNNFGLVVSFNAVFPNDLDFTAPPVNLLARRIVECKTYEEVQQQVVNKFSTSGKSTNAFSTRLDPRKDPVLNAESSPFGDVSVHFTPSPFGAPASLERLHSKAVSLPATHFYHTNVYEVLQTPCFPDPSSLARLKQLHTYSPPNTTADIAAMLGDTNNTAYPLYRNGTKEDADKTLSTVIFNFTCKTASVWWDANPRLSPPTFLWNLW